jgi:hypothetical protein
VFRRRGSCRSSPRPQRRSLHQSCCRRLPLRLQQRSKSSCSFQSKIERNGAIGLRLPQRRGFGPLINGTHTTFRAKRIVSGQAASATSKFPWTLVSMACLNLRFVPYRQGPRGLGDRGWTSALVPTPCGLSSSARQPPAVVGQRGLAIQRLAFRALKNDPSPLNRSADGRR